DLEFDSSGYQRDSTGSSIKVGSDVNIIGTLTGEIAAGYLNRVYQDPRLPIISGPTLDGSLLWQATALTTAKFTAASTVSESAVPGTSGEFSRDLNVQVDHAFLLWLIGTGQIGYGHDDYVGLGRQDNRYFASAGLTYKLSRELQLKGTVREDWLTSNVSGVAYSATSFLAGVRVQR
ncbi:MAG TPA: outer membrane beta-barrel protein, partial [Xanthobacteraceae bacterium]|nr:outer membrane beta-barrel protein [Xanthobacteraceae bacterium]